MSVRGFICGKRSFAVSYYLKFSRELRDTVCKLLGEGGGKRELDFLNFLNLYVQYFRLS